MNESGQAASGVVLASEIVDALLRDGLIAVDERDAMRDRIASGQATADDWLTWITTDEGHDEADS